MIFLTVGVVILFVFARQIVVETTQRGGRHHIKKTWPDWLYITVALVGMATLTTGIGAVFFPW